MDSTELGCIAAGTLAIGLLSFQARNRSSISARRGRYRGAAKPMSVCSSMRSKLDAPKGASAKASTVTFDSAPSVGMTDALSELWELPKANKDAIEEQLGKEGETITSLQHSASKKRTLKPLQEIGTARNRDVGGFEHRIGDSAWELDSRKAPKAKISSDCVGLPMGQYMEHQYEVQHGKETFGPDAATSDMTFLDGLFVSVM